MPTIVIASPKGGAGKSTTAVILGTEFAHAGAPVTMMDCDPNGSLTLWSERGTVPKGMAVLSGIKEGEIIRAIKSHDQDGRIVIVDLEGVASRLVSRAISQADLVVIPMRATTLDATVGVRALELIAEEAEALDRDIPHAVAFTMTRAIQSKAHKGIMSSLRGQGVDIIEPDLMERAAFAALFEFGGGLRDMPAQGSHDAAVANAQQFARAVFDRLTGEAGA